MAFGHGAVQANINNGPSFPVSTATAGQNNPRVSKVGSGFAIVWTDNSDPNSPPRIKFGLHDGTNNWIVQDAPVPAPPTEMSHGMANIVGGLPSGEFVIAYTVAAPSGGTPGSVYAQLFDSSGSSVGNRELVGEVGINGPTHIHPAVASVNGGAGIVVGWTERVDNPNLRKARFKQMDVVAGAGLTQGPSGSLPTGPTESSLLASFSSWNDGFAATYLRGNLGSPFGQFEIPVLFYEFANIASNTPIGQQIADRTGNLLMSSGSSYPDISTNAGGQVIVTWDDAKNSNYYQGAAYAPVLRDANNQTVRDGKGNIVDGISSYWVRIHSQNGPNSDPREILLPAPGGKSTALGRQNTPRVDSYSDCGFVLLWADHSGEKFLKTASSRQYYTRINKQDPCPELGSPKPGSNAAIYDVGVSKTIVPSNNSNLGEYQIEVTNTGTATIPKGTGVKFVDTLPHELYVHGKPNITHPWVCEKGGNFVGNKVKLTAWGAGHSSLPKKFTCAVMTTKDLVPGDTFPMFTIEWEGFRPEENQVEVEIIESNGNGGYNVLTDADGTNNIAKAQ